MKCCFTVFCDLSVKFIVRWLWRKSLYARFWCCYFVNGHCREGVIHGPFFFKQHIHYCLSNALFCVDACSVNKYWAVLNLLKFILVCCAQLCYFLCWTVKLLWWTVSGRVLNHDKPVKHWWNCCSKTPVMVTYVKVIKATGLEKQDTRESHIDVVFHTNLYNHLLS